MWDSHWIGRIYIWQKCIHSPDVCFCSAIATLLCPMSLFVLIYQRDLHEVWHTHLVHVHVHCVKCRNAKPCTHIDILYMHTQVHTRSLRVPQTNNHTQEFFLACPHILFPSTHTHTLMQDNWFPFSCSPAVMHNGMYCLQNEYALLGSSPGVMAEKKNRT